MGALMTCGLALATCSEVIGLTDQEQCHNKDSLRACDLDSSTSIFAAGCCTVILFKMVAPSFVMMTSPSGWHTCVGNVGARLSQAALVDWSTDKHACMHAGASVPSCPCREGPNSCG
jgi:hypothetical protein